MGLLTITRADTSAQLASESRSENPSATYGGSTIASSFVGEKTFSCKDKMMSTNLVIGGKTLACQGKVMPYNVKANYRHVWGKYNVATVYAEASQLCSTQYYSPWGADLTAYVKYWYTGDGQPVLNTSTGQYDISGYSNTKRIDDNWTTRGLCCSKNNYSGDTTPEYVWTNSASAYGWCFNSAKVCVAISGSTSAYYYYTTNSEAKGSYIADVESTDSSAYPTNGKHTDGYWYVKIY